MVAVEGVTGVAASVEDQVIGVYADLGRDENAVAREVDKGDQPRSGVGNCAGGRDRYGKLLRLCCGSDRINSTDDGPVALAAADDECHSGCCQSEPEWGPEGLGYGPNGAPV